MLNCKNLKTSNFNTLMTKEIQLIKDLQLSQCNFKDYINVYIDEISTTLSIDEVFKNMLLTSLNSASLQTEINLTDLNNLNSILEIMLLQNSSLEESVEQYNKLFSKVEKNINIVTEILQKIINSFEQLSTVSGKTVTFSAKNKEKLEEAKKTIMEATKKIAPQKTVSRKIRKIEDNTSSDLLCFFPKTDNDILAISTVQSSYKVMFDKELATVCIEKENFNFSLKTAGVQVSNSENILLVSRENDGYFIMTNMPVDVPAYAKVSRINRNKNFIELGVNDTYLSVFVNNNELTFTDDFGTTVDEKNNSKNNKDVFSVIPSNDVPLPKELERLQVKDKMEIPNPIIPLSTLVTAQNPVVNQVPFTPNSTTMYAQTMVTPDSAQVVNQVPVTPTPVVSQVPVTPDFTSAVNQVPATPAPATIVSQVIATPSSTPVVAQAPVAPVTTPVAAQAPVTPVSTPEVAKAPVTPAPAISQPTEEEKENTTENKDGKVDFSRDNDTLIISEKDNQVILPYKLSEVEKQYQKNGKKKYSSVQELIQNEYVIPTENFKNPIKSRFREAYQLIKKKEHGHLKEAIELGFELMFQSNLNPAIIAACKNLKELDIYLDCLDDNELDKFSCFNIVYNVPPAQGKK